MDFSDPVVTFSIHYLISLIAIYPSAHIIVQMRCRRQRNCIMIDSHTAINAVRGVKTQSVTVMEWRNALVALAEDNRVTLLLLLLY